MVRATRPFLGWGPDPMQKIGSGRNNMYRNEDIQILTIIPPCVLLLMAMIYSRPETRAGPIGISAPLPRVPLRCLSLWRHPLSFRPRRVWHAGCWLLLQKLFGSYSRPAKGAAFLHFLSAARQTRDHGDSEEQQAPQTLSTYLTKSYSLMQSKPEFQPQ